MRRLADGRSEPGHIRGTSPRDLPGTDEIATPGQTTCGPINQGQRHPLAQDPAYRPTRPHRRCKARRGSGSEVVGGELTSFGRGLLGDAGRELLEHEVAVDRGGTPPGRGRPHAAAHRTAQGLSLTGTGLVARPVLRREQGGGRRDRGSGPGELSLGGSGLRALSLVAATSAQA
jgi:hypothetical protein